MPRSSYQDNSNKEYRPKSYQDRVSSAINYQEKISPLINDFTDQPDQYQAKNYYNLENMR